MRVDDHRCRNTEFTLGKNVLRGVNALDLQSLEQSTEIEITPDGVNHPHKVKGHSMLSGPLSELLASVGTLTTDLLKLLGL